MKADKKIFLLDVHKNFIKEDIVWAVLSRLNRCVLVDDCKNADIVFRGVYPINGGSGLISRAFQFLHRRLFFSQSEEKALGLRSQLDPWRKQIWIHVSGEAPNNTSSSSFLNSECDYGIGHEPLAHSNYVRMPHWFQSMDWSDLGFYRSSEAFYRLGEPIKFNELLSGISSGRLAKKNRRCAIISSHMTSPRDILINEINKIMPVDVFGMEGSGPVQYKTNICKRHLIKDYSMVLAPENRLHPGYVTEKIPEAFACGAFPVGWYMAGLNNDFTSGSHVNANDYGAISISNNGQFSELLNNELRKVLKEGVPPLILEKPDLSPLIGLLERVVNEDVN